MPTAALRPYLPDDAPLLAAIYCASIEELAEEDYSEAQREAWMALAEDIDAFAAPLAAQLTLVATIEGSPVGFASLKDNAKIEMLYVHPHVARHGVATLLTDAMEKLAAARGTKRISVDASDTAQPFFAKRGYRDEQRNSIMIEGEWLSTTTMAKDLAPETGSAA